MGNSQRLEPGALLLNDTYRIERVLGQGGFGITYLAEHVRLKKKVAVKEFFPKTLCSRDTDTSRVRCATDANSELVDKLRKKFLKEAEHIAEMDSPYIVRIADVFEENGTAYYIMDYIEGESLSEMVKRKGVLPEQQAIEYITKVGEALTYIHSERMNHLDVKPANIMIRSKDNAPILIDFGLSKQYDSSGNQTSTTPTGISHGYAPMEQYRQEGVKEFSPQADLYSLAATLYYILSGVTPPQALELVNGNLTFPAAIPTHLIGPISKAMSTDPVHRHESVSAFVSDVCGTSDNGDTEFRDGGTQPEPQPNPSSSPKRKLYIGAAIGVAIIITSIVYNVIGICNRTASGGGQIDDTDTVDSVLVTRDEPSNITNGEINGHEWVDLGLPSGLKWATCNVGASSPEDYGDYFSWGETRAKSEYSEQSSVTYGESTSELRSEGIINGSGILTKSHDAASANWGSLWRMPTKAECEELVGKCTWTWTTQGGATGYKVTGPNGNSIFLPAAGRRYGSSLDSTGESGDYWSSSVLDDTYGAYSLNFLSGYHFVGWSYRYFGFSVRPVSE